MPEMVMTLFERELGDAGFGELAEAFGDYAILFVPSSRVSHKSHSAWLNNSTSA
jgi:hypothetical protein